MSDYESQSLGKIFNIIDIDKNGTLSKEDILKGIKNINIEESK